MVWVLSAACMFAQDESDVFYEGKNNQIIWWYFSDVENSLYHHLNAQAQALLNQRGETVSRLEDKQDWQERQEYIRNTLSELVGPFPEKTSLNDKVVRIIEKENFRIEHIVFESRPGFFVTSSLFIPNKLERKAPAILLCSGHAAEAYRSSIYLHEILNYVNKGFVVYAFDPVGQGERLGYYDPETGTSRLKKPTHEHSYVGAQTLITGRSMTNFMVWDGIRALDYLLTRAEVDPGRIGITGRSGGGLQTALIAAMDDRIHASAPECFITNQEMVFKIIGPQDAEQNIPGFINRGLDHADFLNVRVPKPALMVATINDFFSIHGARETALEVKRVYDLFGAAENFAMAEDLDIHASTKKNREAKYAFFQKHLRNPGSSLDEETEELTSRELQVTPTGQVSTSYSGETVYSLNKKYAGQLIEQIQESRKEPQKHREKVTEKARLLSGYQDIEKPVKAVYAGQIVEESYVLDKYYIQGEGDYPVPFWLIVPDESNSNKVILYLHPDGKNRALKEDKEFLSLLSHGYTILAPDFLGTGETGPGVFKGDSYINGISYNLLFAAVHLERSITGIRAGDINRLVSWAGLNLDTEEIYCLAKEQVAPDVLHAALFNPRIKHLALVHPYSSYRAIVMEEYYNSGYVHSLVPAALAAYDLPDIASSIAPGELLIYGPLNGAGEQFMNTIIRDDMNIIQKAYSDQGTPENFRILKGDEGVTLEDALLEWTE